MTAAYAATVRTQVAILTVLNAEIKTMEKQVEAHLASTGEPCANFAHDTTLWCHAVSLQLAMTPLRC